MRSDTDEDAIGSFGFRLDLEDDDHPFVLSAVIDDEYEDEFRLTLAEAGRLQQQLMMGVLAVCFSSITRGLRTALEALDTDELFDDVDTDEPSPTDDTVPVP